MAPMGGELPWFCVDCSAAPVDDVLAPTGLPEVLVVPVDAVEDVLVVVGVVLVLDERREEEILVVNPGISSDLAYNVVLISTPHVHDRKGGFADSV
jgi:hypothetical protein